ncbi:MAG TPA: glycosyltransferase family 39 protein [Flavisolibacter sp.]|nr:glycosyltransferase family 39 protein [Flavisolibacter sp.]
MEQLPTSTAPINQNLLKIFIVFAIALNLTGLFVTIIGPDGALYASIAKEMAITNNYLELKYAGGDWLDKPHFPFWVTAVFFEIFGIHTWSYKLPGILFLFAGAYYTFLFSKKFYNKETSLLAVLILLTAQHIVISNNDVRAEPYLTGLIIASVIHFHAAYAEKSFLHLLLATLFTACSIMTKGLFAVIPIGGAIAGHLIIHKDWKNLFHTRWLIAGILTLIFILPELYALHYQFDLHPEKEVFGRKNVSGIKFFFWDSQFGRFFNTGPIKGKGDIFFFVHTTLWAFLPWSVVLFTGVFLFIKKNSQRPSNAEWLCISGSLLTFLIFSVSKFQLAHYLNIVFPFFAILAAHYLSELKIKAWSSPIYMIQVGLISIMMLAVIVIHVVYRPDNLSLFNLLLLLAFLVMLLLPGKFWNFSFKESTIYRTALAAIIINLYLNLVFYPSLVRYQSGSEAAFYINEINISNLPVVALHNSYHLNFYFENQYILTDTITEFPSRPFYIYLPCTDADKIKNQGIQLQVLKKFEDFHITILKGSFLNKKTRSNTITEFCVGIVN